MMNVVPSSSVTPSLPIGLLTSGAGISGATPAEKLKSACRAVEGLFAGQLLKEIGDSADSASSDPTSGQYADFIQQALAQQVAAGGGFGLARMLEGALTPAMGHAPAALNHPTLHGPDRH